MQVDSPSHVAGSISTGETAANDAIDQEEIKPEITSLKSATRDPYPVKDQVVQKSGMLLVGGYEQMKSEYRLRACY